MKENNALFIATAGGPVSPWIVGAYFAADAFDLYLVLETSGKTMANLKVNPRVAVSISANDASKDFLQASGEVEFLPPAEVEQVMARLNAKMPWFKTYTPVVPTRIKLDKVNVSSLARGWFPAKVVNVTSRAEERA